MKIDKAVDLAFKISDVIVTLQELQRNHGDLPVLVDLDSSYGNIVVGLGVTLKKDNPGLEHDLCNIVIGDRYED